MSKTIKKQIEDTCICQKCANIVPGSQADWRVDITGNKSAGNVCKACQADWAKTVVVDNVVKTKPANGEAPVTKTSAPGTLINNKTSEQYHFVPDGSGERVGVIMTCRSGCSRVELTAAEARHLWVTLKSQGFVRF